MGPSLGRGGPVRANWGPGRGLAGVCRSHHAYSPRVAGRSRGGQVEGPIGVHLDLLLVVGGLLGVVGVLLRAVLVVLLLGGGNA